MIEIAAVAAATGAAAGCGVAMVAFRVGWGRYARREVIVHVIDSNSVRGVVRSAWGPILELRPAWAITGAGALRPLDGGAAIHRDRIDWVQPNPGPLKVPIAAAAPVAHSPQTDQRAEAV